MATTRHLRAGLSYVAPAGLAFGATQMIVPPAKLDPAFVRAEQVVFVVAAGMGAWMALGTRSFFGAMNWLIQSRVYKISTWGFPHAKPLNPGNKLVFWFYRIDGAVVLIGSLYMLISGAYLR